LPDPVRAELKIKGADGAVFPCQFNPSTLRTTYTNQFGDDPPSSHARVTQAKLDVELIFDNTDSGASVYGQLNALEALARSSASKDKDKPDGKVVIVELWWAIKIFEGVVESLTQTIEYWSQDGVPLRATVQISLKETCHELTPKTEQQASRTAADIAIGDADDNTATLAVPPTPKGASDIASKAGNSRAGRTVAAQNGMESMRGGASASAFASASAGASAGAFAGASASATAGASASASASVVAAVSVSAGAKLGAAASFKASGGVSASAGAGASLGFGLGASAGASAGAGIGGAAGIGLSGGAAIGAGAGIGGGIGIGASAGAGFSAGASAGFSAGAGASFGAGASASVGFKGSASAGVTASAGAFAGLGSSKMITGNTGMDISKLMPPAMPSPMGASAQFDVTGKLINDGSTVVATSYSTQTTGFDGTTTRTSGGSVRVM
jgi:Contractile injection system tube protein